MLHTVQHIVRAHSINQRVSYMTHVPKYKKIMNIVTTFILGSGCGLVGRAVASNSRGPRFESSHRQTFILDI